MNVTQPPITPSDVADGAKRAAHEAVDNEWVARFLRFGHVARGLVYLVLGLLALRLSVGIRDEAMSQNGALAVIGRQPFGHVLLVSIAVGFASYALWDVIRAVADPNHEARRRGGLLKRLGFAAGALAYVALAVIAFQFVGNGPQPQTETSYSWTASALAKPLGAWIVGLAGAAWMAVACVQIVHALRGGFLRNLDLASRSHAERRWAKALGRTGITTRGVLFAIIGILLIASALHANADRLTGIDGALLGLVRQPFGRTLLATAGLGLVAFGVYSIMCARWMRIGNA
jgi:hypothetical protein